MRRTMKCATCGSEDVSRDAWAAWNDESQSWELASVFDEAFCHDCDSSTTIDEALLGDEESDATTCESSPI